jgi:uncharacterized protein YndB with AHSA1/START domain
MLGTLLSDDDGRPVLRFERRFAHPPEKVWRALTDPDHLRAWFPAVVDFDLAPGAKLRFGPTPEQRRRYGSSEDTYGTLVRADRPHLLEYTWERDLLRWELRPDTGGGSVLVFTHVCDDRDSVAAHAAGWHAGLDVVRDQLDGREIDWSPWDRAAQLQPDYDRAMA